MPITPAQLATGQPVSHTAVSDFEASRLLCLDDVKHVTRLSKSKIYQLMACGLFPQPVRLSSRCSRWRQRDVAQFLQAL